MVSGNNIKMFDFLNSLKNLPPNQREPAFQEFCKNRERKTINWRAFRNVLPNGDIEYHGYRGEWVRFDTIGNILHGKKL